MLGRDGVGSLFGQTSSGWASVEKSQGDAQLAAWIFSSPFPLSLPAFPIPPRLPPFLGGKLHSAPWALERGVARALGLGLAPLLSFAPPPFFFPGPRAWGGWSC